MREPLWTPSAGRAQSANITRFIAYVNRAHALDIQTYAELYAWSVREPADFWATMWDFADIRHSRSYDTALEDIRRFPGARWFPGARLNFAQNLLRFRDDRTAFVFRGETQRARRMSYAELGDTVARLARSLRQLGVAPGDRVVGYMPNLMETAVAMLAARPGR